MIFWANAGILLLVCYAGNLAGSILTGAHYYMTGLAAGPVGELIANTSAANMSLLTIGLLAPGMADVSVAGYAYNLLTVTLGNMAGAVSYYKKRTLLQ